MSDRYVLWSIEHTAWWRPSRWGYTRDLRDAGRYSREESREIVKDANIVRFEECMIPVECVGDPLNTGPNHCAWCGARIG